MKARAHLSTPDRGLRMLVLIGAAIRIAHWISKWNQPLKLNDSLYYSAQARQLINGTFFREFNSNHPGAQHGPLTSVLMAPLSWADEFVRWQRLITVACGITLVWLIGRLGTRLAGRRCGRVAAGIAAVSPTLWISDGLVMSESVGMLLVATVLFFALKAADDPSRSNLILLGVALGVAPLARSELILLTPAIAVWLWISRTRRGEAPAHAFSRRVLPVGVVAAVVLSPWVTFNLARFERPVLLTTNEAEVLLGANCDDSYSAVGPGAGGWSLLCVLADPDFRDDEEPSVRAARQRSLALDYVREHLPGLPRVLAARVLRTLDLYGLRDQVRGDVGEERVEWAVWAAIASFWLLAVAASFGFRRLPRRERWLLVLPMVLVMFLTIIFYGGHRIRSSAEPSLVLLAAVALAAQIERRWPSIAGRLAAE